MRIQHNIAALNSYRNLTNNNSAVAKNLEKLSSGYRINRAGDDAAGLAISEKMRAQITGLQTAQKNANDGISLVQTAEGALTEVHSMLNRMVELANQSANGTYADAPDRENLQAEIDSLLTEIDRISQATNFNGINLLDGSLGLNGKTFTDITSSPAKVADVLTGDNVGTITATHYGQGVDQVAPEFTIDFADLKVKTPAIAAGGTAVDITLDSLKIGDATVTVVDNTTALGTASTNLKWSITAGSAAGAKEASDVGTLLNNKYAVIGNDVYKMAATGEKVTFTYEGRKAADGTFAAKSTDAGRVAADSFVPKGNVVIGFKEGANAANVTGRDNCHVTNIKDPVVGVDPIRAGASLKLTPDIIARGTLKIGETTFTFDPNMAEKDASGTTIGTKGLTGDDLLKSVTRQISKSGAEITIKKDGAEHKFVIGRGNGTDTIEIEEKVLTDTTKYGKFTEAELKAAFVQSQGQANAKTSVTLKDVPKIGDSINIDGTTYTFGDGDDQVKIGADAAASAKNLADKIGSAASVSGATVTVTAATATADAPEIGSAGLTLQIGDTSDTFNRMTVGVKSMSAKSLGINDIDISTQGGAQAAVDKIKAAINTVSSQRGDLGAIQNRLEHTINNLSVTAENMTAAESRIRDVDMAEEMMAYTKNNILVQAAQAMLAQANQVPQGVLQLLQ